MPGRYDSSAGVSELRARTELLKVIRAGWRPAKDGELPRNPRNSGCPDGLPSAPVALRDSLVEVCELPRNPRNSGCPDGLPSAPVALRESLLFSPPSVPDRTGVVPAAVPDRPPAAVARGASACLPDAPPPPAVVDRGRGVAVRPPSCADGGVSPDFVVAHKKSRRVHIRVAGSRMSVCKAWGCGTLADPTDDALCLGAESAGVGRWDDR